MADPPLPARMTWVSASRSTPVARPTTSACASVCALAAANAHTLAQALVVGRATGVDLDALTRVMTAGSGGSAMLGLKAQPMRDHNYATLFKLDHMLKDVRLCLEEGQAAGVPFPAAAAVREALTAGQGRGLGDADFAAIVEAVEGFAGVRL